MNDWKASFKNREGKRLFSKEFKTNLDQDLGIDTIMTSLISLTFEMGLTNY